MSGPCIPEMFSWFPIRGSTRVPSRRLFPGLGFGGFCGGFLQGSFMRAAFGGAYIFDAS